MLSPDNYKKYIQYEPNSQEKTSLSKKCQICFDIFGTTELALQEYRKSTLTSGGNENV